MGRVAFEEEREPSSAEELCVAVFVQEIATVVASHCSILEVEISEA